MPWAPFALAGLGGVVGGISNAFSSNLNYKLQKEALAFQKSQWNEQKDMALHAYQNTVSDMRQAGLNPLSMSNTNSVPTPSTVTAPQMDTSFISDTLNNVFNQFSTLQTINNQKKVADAQAKYLDSMSKKTDIEALNLNELMSAQIGKLLSDKDYNNVLKKSADFNYTMTKDKWNVDKLYYQDNALFDMLQKKGFANSALYKGYQDKADFNFNSLFGLSNNMPESVKDMSLIYGSRPLHYEYNPKTDDYEFSNLQNDFMLENLSNQTWSTARDLLELLVGGVSSNLGRSRGRF